MNEDDFLSPGGAMRGPLFAHLVEVVGAQRAPQPGERVGVFRIIRELGHGGMGLVFLAARADGVFEQQVALKCTRDEMRSASTQAMAQRERELLARLDHPNIARLIDGGATDDGCLWFAMEYVDGLRLDTHVRECRLDLVARVALLFALCEAVGFAHQHLVIHRDIKPSNVMVSRNGQLKLLDFGIAALSSDAEPRAMALTLAWASPEQRRGDTVTTASDIYQLGLLLTFLIDARPWQEVDSTALSGTHADASAVAVAPPTTAISDRDLCAIVARATATEPGARYPSAAALASDLQAWREHRPVTARNGGSLYVVGRYATRHPLALSSGLLASLALIALAVALAVQSHTAQREAQRATSEAAHARLEAGRAQAAVAFMGELFGQAQPGVNHGKVPTVEDTLSIGGERLLTDTAMPTSLRGELLARLGAIRIERSEFGQGKRLLEAAVPALRTPGADSQRLAEALGYLAYSLDYQDSARAFVLFDEAIRLLTGPAHNDELRLRFQRMRASVLFGIGQAAASRDALTITLDESERLLGAQQVETAMSRVLLTMALNATGQSTTALVHAERGYRDLQQLLGPDHPRTIQAGNGYASTLFRLSRFAEQERVQAELLQHAVKLWGTSHPRYALLLTWQGAALLELQRAAEAVPLLERAAAIFDAADADDDLGSPNTLGELGDAYAALGRDTEALATYQRMLARERERRTALPPDDGTRALKPARLLARLGRHVEALAALAEAQHRVAASTPPDPEIQAEIERWRAQLAAH